MSELEFGSLEDAKSAAASSGYNVIYDNRYKKTTGWPLNLTGATPLVDWPGLTGKNGGGYEYAFNGVTITARPTLPPNHGLTIRSGGKEFASDLLRAIELQKTVGDTVEFLLAE